MIHSSIFYNFYNSGALKNNGAVKLLPENWTTFARIWLNWDILQNVGVAAAP